jgi:hypothetical protein
MSRTHERRAQEKELPQLRWNVMRSGNLFARGGRSEKALSEIDIAKDEIILGETGIATPRLLRTV